MGTGRLEGRIALITGTAQGIGRALARKLAAEGANVVANDLDEDGLSTLEGEIREAGGRCSVLPGDVTQAGFGERALEACLDRFGDLHIVVNNAGYVWNARIVNHTDEQWQAMIDVHATAPFRLLRAVGRYFREQHEAGNSTITRKVVNVSSVSGLFGADTQFSYSAAKSAQIGMTRSLCKDWGRYNVTVNCVAFGFIETRLTQAFDGDVPKIEVMGRSHKVGLPTQALDMMKARIPLGRPGTPEEAAGALVLFCLPESDYISGEVIVAGGGLRD